jgi:hypothetical protein
MPTMLKQRTTDERIELSKNGNNQQKMELAYSLKRHQTDGLTGNQAMIISANLFKYGDVETQKATVENFGYIHGADIETTFKAIYSCFKYGTDEVKESLASKLRSGYTIPLKHRVELGTLGIRVSADGIVE